MGPLSNNSPAAEFARCHFCGRQSRIPEDWTPTPCEYCGRLQFPESSRSRLAVTVAGIAAVVIVTMIAWWIAL